MNAITPVIPAFDPDSRDAQILEAFERVRAHRAYAYSFDGAPYDSLRDAEMEKADDQQIAYEDQVYGNVANTLPGVVARLLLLIPCLDNSRWVDRGLMEQGLLALYREIKNLDGHAQQITYAAHELIDLEWQQNLAAYERSLADFHLVLRVRGLVDAEQFRRRDASEASCDFLRAADALADDLEERFSNDAQVRLLVRTLVPDHAAYLRKVEIIIAEAYQEDATPWLARDTNFLVGRIEADGHIGEAH